MSDLLNPYHEGERAVQHAAGEEHAARSNAAAIADAVTSRGQEFLRAQWMLAVASRDALGRPWASVLFAQPGFLSVLSDGRYIAIDRSVIYSGAATLPWAHLQIGSSLGLLAIDLSTRRRLRVNGVVDLLDDGQLVLRVEQAYPNCPKYIQRRRLLGLTPRQASARVMAREGEVPDAALLAVVEAADTIFVASGHPSRGLDASHRGGKPGFIKTVPPDVLRIPDYQGNGMFNTLGNLAVDGRCGVTVIDFGAPRLLQMTGTAAMHFDIPTEGDDPALTGRSWDFHVQAWQSVELPVRADWEFIDYSPYNPS